jgi:hypothetical protein
MRTLLRGLGDWPNETVFVLQKLGAYRLRTWRSGNPFSLAAQARCSAQYLPIQATNRLHPRRNGAAMSRDDRPLCE